MYVPAASPERVTLALMVPALVPACGPIVSQLACSFALQVSVPPPVLDTVMVWAAGFAPPTLPAKAKPVGLSPIAGLVLPAAVTAIVIGMTCVVMPLPEIVAVPLYVPALSPAGEAVCVMVADPPGGIVTVFPDVPPIQLIESAQVTVNVLVPVLVTVTVSAWLGPPTVPVYASEGGETLTPLVDVV